MNLEKLAYVVLGLTGLAWLALLIMETNLSSLEAWLGWATVGGFVLLLAKAVRDRMSSAEDDHYARTVEK